MKHCDVLIAGGGASGLTAAAYCLKAGLSVLLCEKSSRLGGLVCSFERDGFTFDAGIRAFEDSGVLLPMLRSLHIDLPMVQNPVSLGVAGRWARLSGRAAAADYAALLTELFPESAAEIQAIRHEIERVMSLMDVLYGVENPLFLENMRDPAYLAGTLLPWLVRYNASMRQIKAFGEPIRLYLARFTKNERLVDMICQHFFAETPAFFALSYFGLYLDYRYPLGGTGAFAAALVARCRELGCELETNTAVERVFPAERRALLAGGESVSYRALIWAADATALYTALPQELNRRADRQKRLVSISRGVESVLTLYLGTSVLPEEAAAVTGAHAFYTPVPDGLSSSPDWRARESGGEQALLEWVEEFLQKTTYEISIPVLRDSSLAPVGKTGFVVSTLFDYDLTLWFERHGAYERFKQVCQNAILRALEGMYPGVTAKSSYISCSTPRTIERETGNRFGAITGWAFTNRPLPAVHELKKITLAVKTPVPGVLQCGHWTFSPAGLPTAVITGKLAADAAKRLCARRFAAKTRS